jgi:hypothetical protein
VRTRIPDRDVYVVLQPLPKTRLDVIRKTQTQLGGNVWSGDVQASALLETTSELVDQIHFNQGSNVSFKIRAKLKVPAADQTATALMFVFWDNIPLETPGDFKSKLASADILEVEGGEAYVLEIQTVGTSI